jgi:hypothetical protein
MPQQLTVSALLGSILSEIATPRLDSRLANQLAEEAFPEGLDALLAPHSLFWR